MRITARNLRRIILEEMAKADRNSQRRQIQEGTAERPINASPALINRIIKEELAKFQQQKRLSEARRRKALAKKRNETVYYY
tara:strand:- start:492 stop:737 length:246 start_codon:yes stop_codon:yes gene_type:complete